VREVLVDDETQEATVIVPDDQLSLAIGREGQNARLAAKLTGWKVDIKSETEFSQEEDELTFEEGEEMDGRLRCRPVGRSPMPQRLASGSRYCGLPQHQGSRAVRHQPGDCAERAGGRRDRLARRSQRGSVRGRSPVERATAAFDESAGEDDSAEEESTTRGSADEESAAEEDVAEEELSRMRPSRPRRSSPGAPDEAVEAVEAEEIEEAEDAVEAEEAEDAEEAAAPEEALAEDAATEAERGARHRGRSRRRHLRGTRSPIRGSRGCLRSAFTRSRSSGV